MNEKAKMLSGKLYNPDDLELKAMRKRARKIIKKYNDSDEDNKEELASLLLKLIPNQKEGLHLNAPIHFDYGCFTSFGSHCYANYNLTVLDCAPVTIGDNVMFGPNCSLVTPIHPICAKERIGRVDENNQGYILEYAKPIIIGDNCWIASNVTICGGVSIGCNSVIGAGSVVVKDIPANCLAAGNPCKVIREISDDDLMEKVGGEESCCV